MPDVVGYIPNKTIKAQHLADAPDFPKSASAERALSNIPLPLWDARVWDAVDMRLPSCGPGNGQLESALMCASYYWDPTSADDSFFVAIRNWRVIGITATVEVVGTDGGAVTAAIKKAASGTDIAAGTALHTGTINLKGTVDTNQTLSLSATSTDLDIAVGTRIGIDFTGVLTSARGVVTVLLAPAASADDCQLVTGTFGSADSQIQTGDVKAQGSTTKRFRMRRELSDLYDAGGDLRLRLNAMMKTTLADTSATIDAEVFQLKDDGTLSADLCTTAAQSINSGVNTFANKDFTIDATGLSAGNTLDIRVTIAITDAASGAPVIGVVRDVILRQDVRP
jgi:hypothetical protein